MRTKSTPQRRLRSSVTVQCAARGAPSAARLRAWALAAARLGQQITLRVVGAAEARTLNRAFRKRDYATNVLSFSYGPNQGDLVLCHAVIAREAREWKKELSAHYAHLVVHGMLHLRGLRHGRRMERAEIALLARLGFGDPYALK